MEKQFNPPRVSVIRFGGEDVIATSGKPLDGNFTGEGADLAGAEYFTSLSEFKQANPGSAFTKPWIYTGFNGDAEYDTLDAPAGENEYPLGEFHYAWYNQTEGWLTEGKRFTSYGSDVDNLPY